MPWFWTITWSCIPSPTKRWRTIESESCGRPPAIGLRRKNAAEKYSTFPDESRSGFAPLIVRQSRERKRVSSANRPCVSPSMSPRSSQMQKVEPSRIVSAIRRLRAIRTALDWASALTTSSSTFTCGGRVSAKTTHSATSSGRSGSTFA